MQTLTFTHNVNPNLITAARLAIKALSGTVSPALVLTRDVYWVITFGGGQVVLTEANEAALRNGVWYYDVYLTVGGVESIAQADATFSIYAAEDQTSTPAAVEYATVDIMIDGGGGVPSTGVKMDISFDEAGTIVGYTLLADQVGSVVIDLWKDTYANFPPTDPDSITASAPPTLSSALKATSTTLTGWTTSIAAGDVIRVNIDSIATITRLALSLKVRL